MGESRPRCSPERGSRSMTMGNRSIHNSGTPLSCMGIHCAVTLMLLHIAPPAAQAAGFAGGVDCHGLGEANISVTQGGKCISNGIYNNLENCTFSIDVPDTTVLIVERMSVEFSYDILFFQHLVSWQMAEFSMPCAGDRCAFSGVMTKRAKAIGGIQVKVDSRTTVRWTSDESGGPYQKANSYSGWELCLEYPSPAGYYYSWAVDSLLPCPEGYYCAGSSEPLVCEGEGFLTSWNSTGSTECLLAPPGQYLNHVTRTPHLCPAGYYCPGGVQPAQCSGEHFLEDGLTPGQTECSTCPLPRMASSDGLHCEEQTVLTLMLLTLLGGLAAAAVVRNTRLTYNAPRHIAKSRIVWFMMTYWSVGTLGAALLILLKAESLTEVILVVICFGLVALITFVYFHVTIPSNQHGCCRVVLWSFLHTWMPW